jgi:hypothetical protein
MKWIIRIGIPLAVFVGLATIDFFIFKWITDAIAVVISEKWMQLIKIGVGCIEFCWTVGLIVFLVALSATLASNLTDCIDYNSMKRRAMKNYRLRH